MAEHDSDPQSWLRRRPLARDLMRSAETDAPASGFEARLLGRLRSDLAGADSAPHRVPHEAHTGAVDAVEGGLPVQSFAAESKSLGRAGQRDPIRGKRLMAYTSFAALAAVAAGLVLWGRSGSEKRAPEATHSPTSTSALDGVARALAPCEHAVRADPAIPLIDDFEDGNARMLAHAGRFGTWSYVTVDLPHAAMPVTLAPEPITGSSNANRALRVRDANRHDWRAVWATFGPSCYDASAFAGIRFTGKGPATISFELAIVDAVERQYGGTCQAECGHRHGVSIALGQRFERHEVRFEDLRQAPETPAAARSAFDPKRLLALAFVAPAGSASFDFWIDDVEWIERR
jgi:hypothetical protein